jgi:hypothetical protein
MASPETTIACAGLGVSSNLNSSVTTDPNSSVWSVSVVNGQLIVTFADLFGPVKGGGAVDVFNTDGGFQYQIDANDPTSNDAATATGRLENPWGVTLAPANFGMYSNDLLVGNVWGPGHINAYDPNTGAYLGELLQPNGTPIAIKGLWDLEFGDGTPNSGQTNQLFFDAGPNHPGDSGGGLFGVILAAGDQGGNGGGHAVREAAAPSQPVQQALSTLTVTNSKDSGKGSLRAEIAAAQSGDTIVFSPPLDGKTITLTTGELDLTKNLTIQGPGASELTISGNSANWYSDYGALRNTDASRVFEVAQNATVSLSGLTISNGDGIASALSVSPGGL